MTTRTGTGEDDEIHRLLAGLLKKTDALIVMLIARDGTCMCAEGDRAYVNGAVLALFATEMISRCSDVARALGEERCSSLVQHGAHRHFHATLVGNSYLLAVAFEEHRQTGLVRLQATRAAQALEGLLLPGEASGDHGAGTGGALKRRSADIIDRIFSEGTADTR